MKTQIKATLNGENIVKGHLVTLRQKDGKENVYFLDPQGQLHPVIGAQLRSPVSGAPVVKVSLTSFSSLGSNLLLLGPYSLNPFKIYMSTSNTAIACSDLEFYDVSKCPKTAFYITSNCV